MSDGVVLGETKHIPILSTDAFLVPSYAKNLFHWRIDGRGTKISFYDNQAINRANDAVLPLLSKIELFTVMVQPVATWSLAMISLYTKHWYQRLGHSSWHDESSLQHEIDVMGILTSGIREKFNICWTKKSTSIPKSCGSGVKTKRFFVHTDVFGPVQQESQQ